MKHWMLDGHTPIATADPMEWAKWFEKAGDKRIVCQTQISVGVKVSTVFLGVDHNFLQQGPPILFETMVFSVGLNEEDTYRYTTWDEALAGHMAVVYGLRFPNDE